MRVILDRSYVSHIYDETFSFCTLSKIDYQISCHKCATKKLTRSN